MHDRRRKKKVLAQLEALIKQARDTQQTARPADRSASASSAPQQTSTLRTSAAARPATPAGGSILSRLKRVSEDERNEAAPQVSTQQTFTAAAPIDPVALTAAWREYAASLPQAENYLRTIMATEPRCSGHEIELDIITQSQAMICEHKGLIDYLRGRLGNPGIVIKTHLIEKKEEETAAPFTSKQKLEAMLSESKSLRAMIERFGLSIDY